MRRMEEEGPCPNCGYDGTQERNLSVLEEGTLLNEKYQLGAMIGQGGFGITYAAWDENLERAVAVKEYFPADFVTRNTEVSDEVVCLEKYRAAFLEGRLRFEREGRLLAALQEIPNVVKVLDFFSENNTAYIVMEYIHGVPLDQWCKQQKLKPAQILQHMRPVADALVLLHRQGVVHRDLKPDNLLVEDSGVIWLIDFGSAMQAERHGGTIILSRGYAPVEQYGKEYGRQGPWSDVYGLAAVVYELLTGEAPQEALLRVTKDDLKSPAARGIRLHKKQNAALMAALAVQPEKRTQSMEEFRAGLYLLPMPEQVRWRRRMQRRLITAFALILLFAALIGANFMVGLPLGHGLLYSLRTDGWHILFAWPGQSRRELPGSLLGLPVTAVEQSAFRGDKALEQVTLPPSIQSLGDQAFYGCPRLKTVYLNEALENIGLNVFDGASEELLLWGSRNSAQEAYAQTSHLRFVDGGEMDFEENGTGLTLTRLASDAESIVIPSYVNGVPVTAALVNAMLSNVKEIFFPDMLTEIPDYFCAGCHSLETVHIGKNTRRIGEGCFVNCDALAAVELGESLKTIGAGAFSGTSSLLEIHLPEGLETLEDLAFAFSGIERLDMPDHMTTIGPYAFRSCNNLKEIRLPEGLAEIAEGVFYSCALQSITLPQSIQRIENMAFASTGMEYILLPAGLEYVNMNCFSNCANLRWIEFLGDYPAVDWEDAPSVLADQCSIHLTFGGKPGSAAEACAVACDVPFEDVTGWTEGFALEGRCADFQDVRERKARVPWFNEKENCPVETTVHASQVCDEDGKPMLEEVQLSFFQTEISSGEFSGCSALTRVSCPTDIRSIWPAAFQDCTELQSVDTTSRLKNIGAMAFSGTKIREINLNGAELIDFLAFYGCKELKQVALSPLLSNAFGLLFEDSGVESLEVPGSMDIIENAFSGMDELRLVIVGQGVKSIGEMAFKWCPKLQSILLPSSVNVFCAEHLFSYDCDIWIYSAQMKFHCGLSGEPKAVIHGYPDSTAEAFAKEHGLSFEEITVPWEEAVKSVRGMHS